MSYVPSGSRIGKYEITRTLGMGGFGITYHAIDLTSGREVAIKEYFPSIAFRERDSYFVQAKSSSHSEEYKIGLNRFYRESKIIAQFSHTNIVHVLNVFEGNGTAYIVMEYEHGEDLEHYLRQLGRPLNYNEILEIFMHVLDGLRAVHKKKVLHLDIKPDNILIRTNSTPCLIDFGGARHYAAEDARKSRLVKKVSFMVAADGFSPLEQYNTMEVDKGPWSDVYALGATIYACMSGGKVPIGSLERFAGLTNDQIDPLPLAASRFHDKYPQDLLKLIDSCLSLQRSNRPQNAQEVQDTLIKIANSEPVQRSDVQPKPNSTHEQATASSASLGSSSPNVNSNNIIDRQEKQKELHEGKQQNTCSDNWQHLKAPDENCEYAAFDNRVGAFLIDSFFLMIVVTLSVKLLEALLGVSVSFSMGFFISLILATLYYALMESSLMGSTFGKRAVGIRVVDINRKGISFEKALARTLGKLVSGIILGIGFLMAGFTARKQSLHDIMAGTLVIKMV